jgi:Ala-tRNA(Pro) deacylase
MTIASRLRQFLDSEGVRYDIVSHPRTATSSQSAEVAHIPGSHMAKSVVVHHELGYVLAVVPSTHRIELGTLQDLLDKRLGLATEGEIATLFNDCEVGAIPAVGAAYGVPVILDQSLGDVSDLYFEGGDHKSLVHVSTDAFRLLTKDARRARFSHQA